MSMPVTSVKRVEQHNKLVRDGIIEHIVYNGEKPQYRTIPEDLMPAMLLDKLREEVEEVRMASRGEDRIKELGDVFSVMRCLAEHEGYSVWDIVSASAQKDAARGYFNRRYFLESVNATVFPILRPWEDRVCFAKACDGNIRNPITDLVRTDKFHDEIFWFNDDTKIRVGWDDKERRGIVTVEVDGKADKEIISPVDQSGVFGQTDTFVIAASNRIAHATVDKGAPIGSISHWDWVTIA